MSSTATGIYYRINGEKAFRGPFTEDAVLDWYRSGWFTSTTAFRFGADDTVVSLGDLCDRNGAACPFRSRREQQRRLSESHADTSHDAQLRRMQEQIDATNRMLQASVDRCTKLEQIVSSVVERFLLFSGELSDVKAEWQTIRNTPVVTGASPSVTSSTTTLASAASSSSSLNLLMQLKDDLNSLESVLRGGQEHDEETRGGGGRGEKKDEEQKEEMAERVGAAGDILLLSTSSCGGEVKRTDSGVSTASTAKRTNSSEEDDGDVTMMETVDEQLEATTTTSGAAAGDKPRPVLPYHHPSATVHHHTTAGQAQTGASAAEYTALTRRLVTLESGLREAMERIEEIKAADLSHVLESIDHVNEEMCASHNELKTQRALDVGNQLVIEDAVEALRKDNAVDRERLTEVERFMGRMMSGTESTEDLLTVRAIRAELQSAKERDEFAELRMYGIDEKLRGHTEDLELASERLVSLEEAMTKMLTLDTFKSMLTSHADELSSQMKKTADEVEGVGYRVDRVVDEVDLVSERIDLVSVEVDQVADDVCRVQMSTSQLSVHVADLEKTVEDLLEKTQSSVTGEEYAEDGREEDGAYEDQEEGGTECWAREECACSMCREGRTPKVISDLLNGHRGHFDASRIATRADLIDIRDALSVRRRRSSFVDDTRHFFGEGVRCDHCDVMIREGVSLLAHVSSERHAQATCILKEDLRFWWNRIRNADE